MTDPFEAGLAAIDKVFRKPATYTAAGLDAAPITAIRVDTPSDAYQGMSGQAATIAFEIDPTQLADEPAKGDIITDALGTYRVIDKDLRPDIGRWLLTVAS